jgi:ribosome-associated toxin RatA of RatAB toxin-antitoxin module
MGQISLPATVVGIDAPEVYRRIAAFPEYVRLCDAVREVTVIEASERTMTSRWEVYFHRGILRWTEHAEFFPEVGLITFDEIDGDVEEFRGDWRVEQRGDEVSVVFSVMFDIGIPTLEQILDPIAEEALCDNVSSILHGLLGNSVTVGPPIRQPRRRSCEVLGD